MLNEQLNLDDNNKKELLSSVKRKTRVTKRGKMGWKIGEIDQVLRLRNNRTKYKVIARNVCRTEQSIAGLIYQINERSQKLMSEIVELDSYKRMMGGDVDDSPKPELIETNLAETTDIQNLCFFTGETLEQLMNRLVDQEIKRIREYLKNV